MTLGEQIKNGREAERLSQEELAERVGVSRQAVSKWESGLSVPTGANRRALCRALSLELPEGEGASKRRRAVCLAGWLLAASLLAALLYSLSAAGRTPGEAPAAPALHSVRFYDAAQREVLPEALWYNTARVESILLQWTGGTPGTVRMLFTPAGTETMDQTELLETRTPADGERALLLSAQPLHRESLMGHLYFELDFGSGTVVVTDSLYNVLYDPAALSA